MTEALTTFLPKPKPSGMEKVGTFVKYQTLKIKEYFGKLSQSEFNELLGDDFNLFLEDVPPLGGTFDPSAELEVVKAFPKDVRRKSLESYKNKLAHQREALAQCRLFIEKSIEFNNDAPRDKLLRIVSQFGNYYGFTHAQRTHIEALVDHYYIARKEMLSLRKLIPDDIELVRTLSGADIKKPTKFNISIGAMTLDIETDPFTLTKLIDPSSDTKSLSRAAGFSTESKEHPNVHYTVLSSWKSERFRKGALIHEREHVKNGLFRAIFDKKVLEKDRQLLWTRYQNEKDVQIKQVFLEQFLRSERNYGLNEAKDEIIAKKKGGVAENYSDFLKQRNTDRYDYLAWLRDDESLNKNPMERQTVQKILVDEYQEILGKALRAFDDLSKSTGDVGKSIALLTDKGLPEWPKTVSRLLKQKHV